MREILFRGKAANRDPERSYRTKYKNGDWVYGLLTDAENYAGFSEMTNTNGISGIEVDKNTVGQYTGLTDKNGKQIFEGDVVAYCWYEAEPMNFRINFECGEFLVVPVKKREDVWAIRISGQGENLEIIGNIHDNPELLEG